MARCDDKVAAALLWQLKAIATQEVAKIPANCIDAFFQDESSEDTRGRTVSIGSLDMMCTSTVTPVLTYTPKTLMEKKCFLLDDDSNTSSIIEHHDWSRVETPITIIKRSSSSVGSEEQPLLGSPNEIIKQCKKKRESFVGLTTKSGSVRATLRRKFSWKSYPELEDYLLQNQDEYFQYSSRNYTPEQRKYNNTLTRGLLELAAKEGYVFEEFTLSMVRDRIRCYYKSHSQSAKKKRRR